MMVRHYQSFQRRVANKVMNIEPDELDENKLLDEIQNIIDEK